MSAAELVFDVPCRTGEGPLWHPEESCLYWMDIPNGHLFRFDTRRHSAARVLSGPVLGAATLQDDGALALCGVHGGVWLWNGALRPVINAIAVVRGTRFNDAVADPAGRILSGTMPTSTSKSVLCVIEPDGQSRVVLTGLGQSNGMAMVADGSRLYHVDSRDAVLRVFDYDIDTGTPANAREVARFGTDGAVPDGMAMDEEGLLWIAMWGGGRVVRLDTSGREVDRIALPTSRVSSVAFGGDTLEDLYITTAGGDDRARFGALAGSLFRVRPGVRGLQRHRSALRGK